MSTTSNSPWVSINIDTDIEGFDDNIESPVENILFHEFGWVKPTPRVLTFDWSVEDLYDRFH
jgi:hypothetical protein